MLQKTSFMILLALNVMFKNAAGHIIMHTAYCIHEHGTLNIGSGARLASNFSLANQPRWKTTSN